MNKISSVEPSRLTVTYRPLGDLIPDPRNARTHPKRQIDQIRTSIEAHHGPSHPCDLVGERDGSDLSWPPQPTMP